MKVHLNRRHDSTQNRIRKDLIQERLNTGLNWMCHNRSPVGDGHLREWLLQDKTAKITYLTYISVFHPCWHGRCQDVKCLSHHSTSFNSVSFEQAVENLKAQHVAI